MRLFFILFLFIFGTFSHTASAQLDMQELVSPELLLETEPEYPRPGEEVTISINDYRGGTYGSNVTWLYDGKVVDSAENRRSVTIVAGALNVPTKVEAVLSKPSGGREVLSTTIRPVYLDIIIEAQTRVPDFYLGRSLPSIGSMVNATALVNDGRMRNDLVYTWSLDRKVLEGGPIRGRDQVSFAMPMGDNAILSVQATEPSGRILARRAIFVPSVQPSMNFHEVSALFGVRQSPIDSELILVGNTATVQAEPYHLDTRVYNNPDVAQWKIDNSSQSNTGGSPYQITFQQTGLNGSVKLGFQVRDTTQVLQGANDSIRVRF
jgi:hypothetical protein